MLLKRNKFLDINLDVDELQDLPLDLTDDIVNKIEQHEVLGNLAPVRKKTRQIKNVSSGLRGLKNKFKNKN